METAFDLGAAFGSRDTTCREIFESPILTIPQAEKVLRLKSYPSAQRHIAKLVKARILKPLNEAKYGKPFFSEEILHLALGDSRKTQ